MDVFEGVLSGSRDYFRAAAIQAAHTLGVFGALEVPRTAPELAGVLGVAPRRLARLLDVLALEGVLARAGERFTRAARVPEAREPSAPAGWGRLAEVIRADRPLAEDADPRTLARFHDHLFRTAAEPARALAAWLAPGIGAGTFLDAGGGSGAYTAALLDAAPGSSATLVDRPAVIELARAALQPRRVRFIAGDLLDAPLGDGHRAALLVNLLHLHGPAGCASLVERAARALAPGGRVVIKDLLIHPDRSGPPAGVHFALNMALYTEAGDVHEPERIASWLRAAGLTDLRTEELPGASHVVISAAREAG